MSDARSSSPSHTIPRGNADSPHAPEESPGAGSPSDGVAVARSKDKAEKKRLEQLEDLARSFDMLIYAELALVYYMDNSFLALFFRSLTQFFYLSPKPSLFSDSLPSGSTLARPASSATTGSGAGSTGGAATASTRSTSGNPFVTPNQSSPTISAILVTNLLCALLHVYFDRPSAGEGARGYLHGGLLIDFIGQKGPISKFSLVLLDLLIVGLQVVMLSVNGEVRRATMARKGITPTAAVQDHDAEERGEIRTAGSSSTPSSSAATPSDPTSTESSRLLEDPSVSDSDAFDAIVSTQAPLATLRPLFSAREEYAAYQVPSTGVDGRLAAASMLQGLAERRRMMLAQRGRMQGSPGG